MPETILGEGQFGDAWKRFVDATRRLLSGAPSERFLDPFMSLRDLALQAAERPQLASDLEKAWSRLLGSDPTEGSMPGMASLLLLEIAAFPAAVELVEAEEKASKETSPGRKRLLGIAKASMDSIREVLDNLPPLAKGTLKILSEVVEIFRGD